MQRLATSADARRGHEIAQDLTMSSLATMKEKAPRLNGAGAPRPISVLVLEDQPDDAELMMSQLKSASFAPSWRRVETEADYLEGLDSAPDLILADYSLPKFDAVRALQLLRQRGLDVPLIIISGIVRDEFIVEAVKLGAADFLLKDRMARLGPAVEQAIESRRLRKLQEQTRQALQDAEQRYGMLARVSPVGILHFSPAGQCVDCNERWCAISGLDFKHAAGEGWTGTLHPDDREQVLASWCEAVRARTPFTQEYRFRHPNGTITWVINQAVPEITESGDLRGFVSIVTDITHQKTVEAALRDSEEKGREMCRQLERTNVKYAELYKTAQRFVEDVSHEFRTPLTVVKGYAEAMADGLAGPITGEQKEFLGYVSDRTRDLAQMVDDLLDSSKLRAGTIRIDRKRHSVEDIIAHARMMIRSKANANQIEVVENIAADLPDVYADAEKCGRVLVNFAVNAIKFSPTGSRIELWARRTAEGGAEIGVTDQGPGISLENQQLLFARFRQVGETQNCSVKGFGLGLNIARDLVALNLGQIGVVSAPGQGSTFSFNLPPDDPRAVLEAYAGYLHQLPEREGNICLLKVDRPATEGSDQAIHDFLAATLQPADLVLYRARDHAFLLVGYTDDLSGWVERMRKSAAKFASQSESPQTDNSLRVDVMGAWPWPASEKQAIARMAEEFSTGDPTHA
jgi:PAS domain S-box-containing protein